MATLGYIRSPPALLKDIFSFGKQAVKKQRRNQKLEQVTTLAAFCGSHAEGGETKADQEADKKRGS